MKLVKQTKNISILTLVFAVLLQLLSVRHVISECRSFEWMCDNQESCIDNDEKCDGRADCPDGSDETAVNCFSGTTCPAYSFQCKYGACISGSRECDGKHDCADKSDEMFCNGNESSLNMQGSCRSGEMECVTTKECIDSSYVCDGRANCPDGSDETLQLCGRVTCSIGFQCAYGACVSGRAKCNGTIECQDGSDEGWVLCGYERKFPNTINRPQPDFVGPRFQDAQDAGFSCKIPEGLSGVVVSYVTSDTRLSPGTLVADDVTILAKCEKKGDKPVDLYCTNGTWLGEFPKCRVFCDKSILTGISTTHTCHQNGIEHDSFCEPSVLPNTRITFYCALGYRPSTSQVQEIQCHQDGAYSEKRIPCKQLCGQRAPGVEGLTKNGFKTTPSKAPWHVSIYRNDDNVQTHICGGSIISPRIIISAAHCFWNKTKPRPPDLYRIIAGKLTKQYDVAENEGRPQTVEVEQIIISKDYNDANYLENQFYADIAIMKLKTPLIYNENVSSVCLYYHQGDSEDYVRSNVIGSITGYGRTGVLERLSMATVSTDECRNLRDGKSLAGDKFCLRNDNLNSTLCQGDSGGGFVELNNGAFYLLGIVSYTPATQQSCVTSDFVGLSNVRYMRNDLFSKLQIHMNSDKELF